MSKPKDEKDTTTPWVCKLMDYKREEYRKAKESKIRKQSDQQKGKTTLKTTVKEMQFRGNIELNDIKTKLKKVLELFAEGYPVKMIFTPSFQQMKKDPNRLLWLKNEILSGKESGHFYLKNGNQNYRHFIDMYRKEAMGEEENDYVVGFDEKNGIGLKPYFVQGKVMEKKGKDPT